MDLYSFTYRGLLTDASLDRAGRKRKVTVAEIDTESYEEALAFEMLDEEYLAASRRMSLVYTALHAFENSVRKLVTSTMIEAYKETWWDKVPKRIRDKVAARKEDDAKFKWHGSRGSDNITYCDFGDLSNIIVTNWNKFEPILHDMEWSKSILVTLEKSRNIIMHGGELSMQDVHRIGMNIRDWIRQAG